MKHFFFVFIYNILCLSLRKLEVEVSNMYRFELPLNGILEYGSILKKYRLPKKSQTNFTDLKDENGNEIGYFWSMLKQDLDQINEFRNIFIKEEYFTNDNFNVSPSYIITSLYPNCNLVYATPKFSLNNKQRAGCSLKIKAENFDICDFFDDNFLDFINSFNNRKEVLKSSCFKIKQDLKNKRMLGIHGLLTNKKYILLFFNRNYSKVQFFFEKFYKIIRFADIIPLTEIESLFTETVDDCMENIVDEDWKKYFDMNSLNYDKRRKILLWFLLLDTMNMINLCINPSFCFNLITSSLVKEELLGESTVVLIFDLLNIPTFVFNNLAIRDQNNEIFDCGRFSKFEGKLFVYYDTHNLIKNEVKSLSISILTKNGKFESGDLDVSKFY